MSRISPETWSRLGDIPHGESLVARLAAPDQTDRLAAALDAEGRRHLLIALRPEEQSHDDRESRGVSVATRELLVSGQPPQRYIDIVCADASGHDVFDIVGGEIADRLGSRRETPADVIARVLAKWRRFWGQLPRQILSREAQLGLFAELWFLHMWLTPLAGVREAAARWRGPFGARHDFEWQGRSVEVKATTSTRGAIHWINGVEQLAEPENGDLLLFSIRLREERGATNTLPGLVALCRAAAEADAEAIAKLESALALAGYSPAHEEDYSNLHLRVAAEGLYRVAENFPRLTPASFAPSLPAGIERVEYEISLAGFQHLRVAQRAADLRGL